MLRIRSHTAVVSANAKDGSACGEAGSAGLAGVGLAVVGLAGVGLAVVGLAGAGLAPPWPTRVIVPQPVFFFDRERIRQYNVSWRNPN